MKLSIIIPVYNERKSILEILKRVEQTNIGHIKKEIIIVDDYSTDGTRELLKKSKKYKILFHEKNKGKGSAIRTGIKHARGDIILIQDADLEYDPRDYPSLLRPIIKGETKIVYGSRFLEKSHDIFGNKRIIIPTHFIGNKILSFITAILYFRKITDMETCYKVFKREVLQGINLNAQRFDFEPEITAKLIKKNYKIIEVPIRFSPRSFSDGKKINWKDGLKALFILIKYRFVD